MYSCMAIVRLYWEYSAYSCTARTLVHSVCNSLGRTVRGSTVAAAASHARVRDDQRPGASQGQGVRLSDSQQLISAYDSEKFSC
jgi:hypothetical protein